MVITVWYSVPRMLTAPAFLVEVSKPHGMLVNNLLLSRQGTGCLMVLDTIKVSAPGTSDSGGIYPSVYVVVPHGSLVS